MRFPIKFLGGARALSSLKDAALDKAKQRAALEAVLRLMVNYSKQHGPWTDRTGNLRASIDYKIDKTSEGLLGVFYAGMDYAVHVEFRHGYWVLSGAVEHYRPMLKKIFGSELEIVERKLPGRP